MLSKISWGQFGSVVLALLVVYYVLVVGKFYRKDIVGFLSGKRRAPKGGVPAVGPSAGLAAAGSATAGQAELFAGKEAKEEVPEMYKVMEKVLERLKGVMDEAMASKAGRQEVMDHIRTVLAGFRQLKKTPYQVSINNYLVRVCSSHFSLALDEAQLEGLWG